DPLPRRQRTRRHRTLFDQRRQGRQLRQRKLRLRPAGPQLARQPHDSERQFAGQLGFRVVHIARIASITPPIPANESTAARPRRRSGGVHARLTMMATETPADTAPRPPAAPPLPRILLQPWPVITV